MKTLILALLMLSSSLHAGPRTSASYTVTTDTTDHGGKRTSSASYTNDASAGGVVGITTSVNDTNKQGYIGQLTEVTALQLAAAPTTVNETATRQLSATQVLDDLTTHAVPASLITWSITGPSLASTISTSGLVTAGAVYQNESITAQGIHAGITGTLSLTILNTLPDNFGTYAADGLGDDWQVVHFGQNNPNAAPLLDPDFDGHTNLFEYTAGLIPTSAASKFNWRIAPVPGFPSQKHLVFSPLVAGRTYTVKTATTLGVPMTTLTGTTFTDSGNERTVTDPTATGSAKFYKVEITKD
ncbi:MAG: hypothetical protein IPK22_01510 [Verrucomicrobiaceae bacterium]|nr:hypothetical protein [Verrucomicrobiaceae bacterium]